MIINNTHRFIFVHIPKTAGTSVTSALSNFSNFHDIEIGGTQLGEAIQPYMRKRYGLHKHASASKIREVMGPAVFDGFRSFAFVRNPFSRLQSSYHFLKSWANFSGPFSDEFDKCSSFSEFLASEIWIEFSGPDEIFRPQTYWLNDPKTGRRLVNFIGKLEDLSSDVGSLSEFLFAQSGRLKLENLNKTPSYKKLTEWPDRSVEKCLEFYAADFQQLQYSESL